VLGGVNNPPGVIVPPLAAQLTSVLETPGVRILNCNVCDVVRLARAGDTTKGAVTALRERMVTLEEPVLDASDCQMAVTVTVGGLGTELGAV
jgi:hypothetical protein